MCLQEEASSRPLISDVVTALTFLADPNYDPPDDIKDPLPITVPNIGIETNQNETEGGKEQLQQNEEESHERKNEEDSHERKNEEDSHERESEGDSHERKNEGDSHERKNEEDS
jgi:hypothetical protein